MTFDRDWAIRKLDMPRRKRELERYIAKYLPELREMPKGTVVDVGCGPGDFLALCREMGHEVLGVDAPSGEGGMGDAYLDLCAQECDKCMIPRLNIGLNGWLMELVSGCCDECLACVNMRGSIEQASAPHLIGPPHHEHHNCRELDWKEDAGDWLAFLLNNIGDALRPGGILLIHANGTKSTDSWYDETVRRHAESAGLSLVHQEGLLLHKWIK